MDKSSRLDIPLEAQRRAWNEWNSRWREDGVGEVSSRQAECVERWLGELGRRDLRILDAGCGTGWMSERLQAFGTVTGLDLADEVLQRARERLPNVTFVAGDVFNVALAEASFDAIVSLEVLSHVVDQSGFFEQLARLLKPGGMLVVATQNRPVLERWSAVGGPAPGQIRHWVDAKALRRLAQLRFDVEELTSVLPVGDQGLLRLVNSRLFNWPAALLLGRSRRNRLKERLLLGHTLMLRARRR